MAAGWELRGVAIIGVPEFLKSYRSSRRGWMCEAKEKSKLSFGSGPAGVWVPGLFSGRVVRQGESGGGEETLGMTGWRADSNSLSSNPCP